IVSGGLLHETTTAGAQYWTIVDTSVDFTQHFTLEARLRVNSSNYVPNIGTGTREGYYFIVNDRTLPPSYPIGLASAGFNINTTRTPNVPLRPFAIADGNFHTYR